MGDVTIQRRFMKHVEMTPECWNWGGDSDPDGYGVFHAVGDRFKAHRVSWMMDTAMNPKDLQILQTCGNRSCVNPEHLVARRIESRSSCSGL